LGVTTFLESSTCIIGTSRTIPVDLIVNDGVSAVKIIQANGGVQDILDQKSL